MGDQVLLKLHPYTQSSMVNRPFPKLSYKYFGPYTVEERVGSVAYKMKLPRDSLIHPASGFSHTSSLSRFSTETIYSRFHTCLLQASSAD
jgi:hypothetical protein